MLYLVKHQIEHLALPFGTLKVGIADIADTGIGERLLSVHMVDAFLDRPALELDRSEFIFGFHIHSTYGINERNIMGLVIRAS